MPHVIELILNGLTCQRCVAKVQQQLAQLPGVQQAHVTLTQATITGEASALALIDAVKQAGYQATLACAPLPSVARHRVAPLTKPAPKIDLHRAGGVTLSLETQKLARPAIVTASQQNHSTLNPSSTDNHPAQSAPPASESFPAPKIDLRRAGGVTPSSETQKLARPAIVTLSQQNRSTLNPSSTDNPPAPPASESFPTPKIDLRRAGGVTPSSETQKLARPAIVALSQQTRSTPNPLSTNNPPAQPTPPADHTRLPPASPDTETHQLLINDMHCASCVNRVQQTLQQIPGVTLVQINLAQRSAQISGSASVARMLAALRQAGYPAQWLEDEQHWRERERQHHQAQSRRFRWQAALALVAGVLLMLWGMQSHNMTLSPQNHALWLIIGIVTLLIMLLTGGQYYRNAWRALRRGSATMDSLITLGTVAAWLYSISVNLLPQSFPPAARHLYYEACLMILGLVNLGHWLESRGRRRASNALAQLMDLTPPTATQITAEGAKPIALADITPGMILQLIQGERVPVDGELTQGEVWIDESMLTGEPGAQHRQSGQTVYAGTLVQDGSATLRARLTGKATTLSRIIALVRKAQSSKPAIGKLADRIAVVFVPLVLLIALISGAIWYGFGPAPQIAYSLVIATTVLIIACPCALGLATPMSTIAGIARAAEKGILVRDADALQQASQLDTLVFDKTGTLTLGKAQVTHIYTRDHLDEHIDEQQVLALAAALESASSHPLARALLEKARGLALPAASHIRTHKGQGISGVIDGQSLLLGSPAWFEAQQIDTRPLAAQITASAQQGASPVLLAAQGQLLALFVIFDPIRDDSPAALQALKKAGYRLIMLTGDNPITANAVARQLGIDQVIAGVLPDGKAQIIEQLQQQGRRVAMIGDGINDAPALAQAQVGIALASGSHIAIETASLTLMRHSLHAVADALNIAKATLRNMKQNLAGAFLYNVIAIPIAAGLLWPHYGILLNPVIAAGAMALSSVTVVGNANRLLRQK